MVEELRHATPRSVELILPPCVLKIEKIVKIVYSHLLDGSMATSM